MPSVLTALKDKYIDARGFHTDRKLLIIESDDWGSIRMPSYETFCNLQKCGDHPERDGFLRNDCLETEEELNDLFAVLNYVSDVKGDPAKVTANFAVANPDFDKIDVASGQYFYEPFYETYQRYSASSRTLEKVKEGMAIGCFHPQLHCREHMNVNRWMKALKCNSADARLAYDNRMIGVYASFSENNRFGYMDAFNTDCTEIDELNLILSDAAELFEKTFGYESKTFVASCFVWSKEFEYALAKNGIVGIQSAPWQNEAVGTNGIYKLKRKLHYTGQRNRCGQVYTVRNCNYEPAYYDNSKECVENCFDQVSRSFYNKKPAIINSHRFNYIGSINKSNSIRNLEGLRDLLCRIKHSFPDVEFITTDRLVEIMLGDENE